MNLFTDWNSPLPPARKKYKKPPIPPKNDSLDLPKLPKHLLEAKQLSAEVVEQYLLEIMKNKEVCTSVGRLLSEWIKIKYDMEKDTDKDEVTQEEIEKIIRSLELEE